MVNMRAHVTHRAMREPFVKLRGVIQNVRMDSVTETAQETITANVTLTIKELPVRMLVSRMKLF